MPTVRDSVLRDALSARLEVSRGRFALGERGGTYILKPQTELYENLPE